MVESLGDNICDNCGSDRGPPDFSSVSVDNCGTCKRRTCAQCSIMLEFCGRNMCFDCLKGKHQDGTPFESRCPACDTGLREARLHQAAKSGDVESIQKICDEGVNVNVRERQCFVQAGWAPLLHKGRTPMYYAVLGGHIDAVGKLLSLGASDNSIASEYPDSHIDIIQLAEEKKHPVIKNMLIESFAHRKLTGEDISFVVRRVMKDRVAELLDQVPVNCIDTEDLFGFTPLQEAIITDDLDMVRLLLEKSSKSDTGSKNATRALKLAVGNNCNDIVVELLSRGFSFEGAESSEWSDLLYSAVMSNNIDLASLIIDKGADIETIHKNPYSQTVLHYAIADSKVEMAGFLIEKGADLNARNEEGMGPLHAASRNRSSELVDKLIAAGADVNSEDDDGRTPLHHVALRSPSDVKIKYNINDESFENTETELNDTFTELSPMVYETMLHILLSGILNRTDAIVTSLLYKSAHLQQKDKSGLTPLKTALISDSVISAYSLAKAGAELEPSSLEHVGKLKDLGLAGNTIESLLKLKSYYENDPADI